MIIPDIGAESMTPVVAPSRPLPPTLSVTDTQAIKNSALSVSELKNWSNSWHYAGIAFLGTKDPTVHWTYAIVTLKAPSTSTPFACDTDWSAWIKVDLATKKVVSADYPSMKLHICKGATGSPGTHAGYSIATQNDVGGATSYYGNYAEIPTPSFSSSIYDHLDKAYVEQFLNAEWTSGTTGCSTSSGFCLEQAGWSITAYPGCSGCGISANSTHVTYVDESVNNDEYIRDTGLTWVNGQSLDSSIACASSNYDITITYGSQLFSEVTNIPCTSPQNKDVYNNSVFFENTDKQTSSNWSSYITGTVSATNAFEYDSLGNSYQWSTSNNKDVSTCTSPPTITASSVITSGHLYSGGTAIWGSLSSQPYAC
jgi:hypothetical protein